MSYLCHLGRWRARRDVYSTADWSVSEYKGFATYLVLDQELDTLDRSSGSLGDGGGDTTHWEQLSVLIVVDKAFRVRKIRSVAGSSNFIEFIAGRYWMWFDILKKSTTKPY